MKYRPEIDGLRAIAVVPVILFHAGFTTFSGGYVGVDIFFVISGFLITSIILSELEGQRFSILGFYERRMRRILPALFTVMVACLPLAWAWMLPSQLEEFYKSIIAVTLFVSNVFFWKADDYFSTASELKPLLHTWSLGVEEQFYFIFPPLLWLLWRLGRNKALWIIVILAALSLLLSEWGWRHRPSANFFLAPTRAWELLAGSLSAFYLSGRNAISSNSVSVLGLCLILFSVFFFDEDVPVPSLYTVAPVLGASFVILFGGGNTYVARLLSLRPVVWFGLISYSAYLWHQPLFAFARLRSIYEPKQTVMLGLIMVTFVLAYVTWRYIEKPFRFSPGTAIRSRRGIFLVSAISGVSLICFGAAAIHVNTLFLRRLDESSAHIRPKQPDLNCTQGFDDTVLAGCRFGSEKSKKLVIAIGDSHMGQWSNVLSDLATSNDLRIELYSKGACALPSVSYVYPKIDRIYDECNTWKDALVSRINETRPNLVLAQNSSLGYLDDGISLTIQDWKSGLVDFGSKFSSINRVVWILDNPRFGFDGWNCFERVFYNSANEDICSQDQEEALPSAIRSAERSALGRFRNFEFADFSDVFCDDTKCFAVRGGIPLMRDGNHMSQNAAQKLKGRMAELIAGSGSK